MKKLFIHPSHLVQFSTDKARFHQEDIPGLTFEDPEKYTPAFDFGFDTEGNLEYFRLLGTRKDFEAFQKQLTAIPIPDKYDIPQYGLKAASPLELIDYLLDNWNAFEEEIESLPL